MLEQAKSGNDSMITDFNEEWERYALINFIHESNTKCSKIISKKFKQYYLHDQPVSIENLKGIGYVSRIYFPILFDKYFFYLYFYR
jgi:hypothetical protein